MDHTPPNAFPVDQAAVRVVASRVKFTNTVEIRTDVEGFNSGRVYYIRAESGGECRRIAADLERCSEVARRHFELRSWWERARDRLKSAYESAWVQAVVGALILAVGDHPIVKALRSPLSPPEQNPHL